MANQEHDSRQDGDPMWTAEPMPPTGGLTQIRPPTLSRTGGMPPTVRTPSSGTGLRLSERGAVATPTNPKVAKALALFDLPEATTRCLSVSLALHLATAEKSVYGSHGFERTALGPFKLISGMTLDDMKRDLYEIERTTMRASSDQIAAIVAKLAVRTKMRVQGEGEAALLAETMVDDLSAYPLDVAEWACEFWIKGGADNKFFPSWPELRDLCERRMEGRNRLVRALTWGIQQAEQAA